MGHEPGTHLKVEGDFQAEFLLEWTQEIGDLEISSWKDLKEATEYGATALALLLMRELPGFDIFKRQDQNQVSDFEARKEIIPGKAPLRAKLEVSGILKETPSNMVTARVSVKERNIKKRSNLNLPVYIVVVEFGQPKAKLVKI